jgi:hypothetical protein
MSLETFKEALDSLLDFRGVVGMIGGLPLLNPNIKEMISYITAKRPKQGIGFWLNDYLNPEYEKMVKDGFGYINYNPHKPPSLHSPVWISSKTMIPDETKRKELHSNCWIPNTWSASITPKGVYRCEVAAAMDMLLNANLGLPITKDWWLLPNEAFQKQFDYFCDKCGLCMNIDGLPDTTKNELVTEDNLELLKNVGSRKILKGEYEIVKPDTKLATTDKPWLYIKQMREKNNG